RYPDDATVQRGHSRGARGGNRAGAGRTDGQARGDRRGGRLAVFGRGRLRCWARHGYGWRPNGVVMLGASGEAQDVEGREKIRSGEASVGQFPMREETQSSCERPARFVHIRSDVAMDKPTAST